MVISQFLSAGVGWTAILSALIAWRGSRSWGIMFWFLYPWLWRGVCKICADSLGIWIVVKLEFFANYVGIRRLADLLGIAVLCGVCAFTSLFRRFGVIWLLAMGRWYYTQAPVVEPPGFGLFSQHTTTSYVGRCSGKFLTTVERRWSTMYLNLSISN